MSISRFSLPTLTGIWGVNSAKGCMADHLAAGELGRGMPTRKISCEIVLV